MCVRLASNMRVLRDHRQDCICATQSNPPMAQSSISPLVFSLSSSLGKLWEEWEIQCLILVSFGLQVFLFFVAGMRRRSASRILRSLLWLAYLSADSVAIFVLGHLTFHANEPQHQLLFFWAPFVLLHLGGQDTLTALSIQDNDLWTRHLLGFVTQVAVAGYVISRTSWPDRQLLAAMVLICLSGCFKYAEHTICLYRASLAGLRETPLLLWEQYIFSTMTESGEDLKQFLTERFRRMVKANGRRHSSRTFDMSTPIAISLVLDNPLNDPAYIRTTDQDMESLLQGLKSNEDRCRVYDYISVRPVLLYEHLYTKAPLRTSYIRGLNITNQFYRHWSCSSFPLVLFRFLGYTFLLFFTFLSTSTALVLFFKVVEKGQLYSRADVTVSYILLAGAIILEVASLFVSICSYLGCRDIFQSGRKQWSEMLGQYNMTKDLTRQNTTCIMSFVPQWIGKHLDDNTSRIPVSNDLKKIVLDKLLEFGSMKQDVTFVNTHGKFALGKWRHTRKDSVSTRLESALNPIIDDLEVPSSMLILHIATDILYFHDNKSINSEQQMMKKISRELSNYVMYLVFKCGVMLASRTKVRHDMTHKDMEEIVKKHINLGEKEAIMQVFKLEDLVNISPYFRS